MTRPRDFDALYEAQQTFGARERAAIDAAREAPIDQARERLAELAAQRDAWNRHHEHALRESSRDTGIEHARGWSL